ncbi:tripartite motif-containing protein 45 isoform X5 [Octopus bimaculoides]|uniref:tripartite motif-containing protein 45 isoform X5 n=1 Tax=Octopus bimaculoides TaxID=37653 RepID=UPI0022E39B65|nr:tripartite motif-containing protein 45 isoform X5 [Octopus bimaculoides]
MDDHADTAITGKAERRRNRRRLEVGSRYHTTAIDINDIMAATTTTGNKLAQEIHDEFLTCKICLEGFKNPKCLDCLHTFCEQCIENHVMSECTYKKYSDYREFTCPLCRKRTNLPIGGVKKLPDNFLVSSLGEVVARQRPSKFPFCDICKMVNRKHREASSKCLDCNKLLCKPCVELHKETKVTKSHSLFDVEIEKDIECKEHKEEVVRFYCEPCQACICVLCTFNEHKDHEITNFSDAVVKYKDSIQRLLESCKDRINVYDTQIDTLGRCDTLIKDAEQKIHDVAIAFIAEIRSKEKTLVEELHSLYGSEVMEYINRKVEMQSNLESLKNTCNLTELVLKGKDIELLLLKNQVQEKLSCLSEIELKELPNTVCKQILFTPGSIDLGTIEDPDRPKPKVSMQPRRSLSAADYWREKSPTRAPPTSSTSTQTEKEDKSQKLREAAIQTEVEETPAPPGADDKSISTDKVETEEKAVNTRSRSLQSLTYQLQRNSKEGSPENNGEPQTPPEPQSSPVINRRHHRRRRERPRAMEVGDEPTTYTSACVISSTNKTEKEDKSPSDDSKKKNCLLQ